MVESLKQFDLDTKVISIQFLLHIIKVTLTCKCPPYILVWTVYWDFAVGTVGEGRKTGIKSSR